MQVVLILQKINTKDGENFIFYIKSMKPSQNNGHIVNPFFAVIAKHIICKKKNSFHQQSEINISGINIIFVVLVE